MPEKLSIEVIKHSNKDIRIIIKSDSKTVRASLDDLFFAKSLVEEAIITSTIFTEAKTFVELMEDR